ncbi:MAG: alpha/beta hydrolase [Actinomycetota bacterium]|nr:alpha/beta hydrolase [Actinomycetota bacterium]
MTRTGLLGASVDYRLAPERPFPAAVEDALQTYLGLLETGVPAARIVLRGESAGGGLALALLVTLRDRGLPQPAAAFVFSPWADLTLTGSTMTSKADEDPHSPPRGCEPARWTTRTARIWRSRGSAQRWPTSPVFRRCSSNAGPLRSCWPTHCGSPPAPPSATCASRSRSPPGVLSVRRGNSLASGSDLGDVLVDGDGA